MTSACACARDSARPRSTSRTSRRFFIAAVSPTRSRLRRARGEARDDLFQHARVRVQGAEARLRPLGRLVGCAPGRLRSVQRDVAVAVEQVVHELEQEAELVAERAPRRLLALRYAGGPQTEADGRREEA